MTKIMGQDNEEQTSLGVADESLRPAQERCPHCRKWVESVYEHTSNEDCDVINGQIADAIQNGVE